MIERFFPKYPPNPPTSPFREGAQPKTSSQNIPISPQPKNDAGCFRCKQKGHRARDCPSITPSRNAPTVDDSFPKYPQQQECPELQCKCGRPCAVRTSRTLRNPDRDFYTCQKPTSRGCDFFQWCDAPVVNNPAKQAQQLPICECTAGQCRVVDVKGVEYYACHLKKGQGACNHLVKCCGLTNTSENIINHATNEPHPTPPHPTHNLNVQEPINNGTNRHQSIRDKEKDLHSYKPPTPPKPISDDHEQAGLGSSPMKRPNPFEVSPPKRKRVESLDNHKNPATSNIRAIYGLVGSFIPESVPRLERRVGEVRSSPMGRLSFADECSICGGGHDVIKCIAPVM